MGQRKKDRGARHGAATPAVAALEAAGVPYRLHTFDVALDAGGERFGVQVARALSVPADRLFKTLMVADPDGALAACVVPVSGQLDLRAAAAVLGVKRLALADLAVVERRTGYVRGGVSPWASAGPTPSSWTPPLSTRSSCTSPAGNAAWMWRSRPPTSCR